MNETDSQDVEVEFGELNKVFKYSEEISDKSHEIKDVFEDEFGNVGRSGNGFEDYFERMDMALVGAINEEDRGDISSGLLNGVSGLSREEEKEVRKQDEDIAELLRFLKRKHFTEITRRVKRIYQGDNWWSNIETDHKFRGNHAAFTHHITIDNKEKVDFSSSLRASSTLSRHFLKQVLEAPEVLGKDVINEMDRSVVEEINEISTDILDRIEEYENEFEDDDVENKEETDSKQESSSE